MTTQEIEQLNKRQQIENIYAFSTGTEQWHRHQFSKTIYTDGVKEVAETAGAYWLIDAILSYNRQEEFQIWYLVVGDNKVANLAMCEDKGKPNLVHQRIPHTDFPTGIWKFYLSGGVLMLPSEY